jgi:hypothetical protein
MHCYYCWLEGRDDWFVCFDFDIHALATTLVSSYNMPPRLLKSRSMKTCGKRAIERRYFFWRLFVLPSSVLSLESKPCVPCRHSISVPASSPVMQPVGHTRLILVLLLHRVL